MTYCQRKDVVSFRTFGNRVGLRTVGELLRMHLRKADQVECVPEHVANGFVSDAM